MVLELKLLKNAISQVFEYYDQNNITKLKIEKDYYWNILSEQIHDVYNKPQKFSIGQLTDDISEIIDFINNKDQNISNISHIVPHIIPLLRLLVNKNDNIEY